MVGGNLQLNVIQLLLFKSAWENLVCAVYLSEMWEAGVLSPVGEE